MTIPTQQKAFFLTAKQGDFAVGDTEVPRPNAGEVLVRIESTAPTYLEQHIQHTGSYVEKYPAIVGWDAAGTVVLLGGNVENFSIGDRVLFVSDFDNRTAAHQQYAVSKAVFMSKIPDNISFDQAATIPVNLMTALNGLYTDPVPRMNVGSVNLTPFWREDGRGKYVGQPALILGASSSVGQFATQLVRLSGFSPIIAVASSKHADLIQSLGATHVIDRNLSKEDISAKIKGITAEPIRVIYDAVGYPETQSLGYDILSPGGTMASVLRPNIDKDKLEKDKSIYFVFGSPHFPEYVDVATGIYKALPQLLASGELKPNIPEVIPGGLASIPQGWEKMTKNQVSGRKLVVHPQETT